MKQKIEWYKEVLELEPGSKVFFPLAKLLAADKQGDEAAAVLRQGVLRHPDHVEARLLLVELLYRRGDDEELSAQTDVLAHLFSAYPGFWSAWCESISADPRMRDAAQALRFFVTGLQGKEIGWSEVVEQGLQAVLRDMGVPGAAGFEAGLSDAGPVPRSPPAGPAAGSGGVAVPACDLEIRALLSPPAQEQAQDEDAGGADEGEEVDESISLRTRSMAEVLAEQGDYAGALDIYRELLQSAPSGDRPSLEARVEELSRCMSEAGASGGREEKGPPFAGESSKIVNLFESLSFVESLAERLEARAR
ncbi:MAG: tetratricopeptide repeat-containing protein [Desulfovibrio sp.]|jgi:tetratricopeptide (TPR) repeat protein|nr:tetratricopeptide repeat-containing protein [Desulfovibrio sp.]